MGLNVMTSSLDYRTINRIGPQIVPAADSQSDAIVTIIFGLGRAGDR